MNGAGVRQQSLNVNNNSRTIKNQRHMGEASSMDHKVSGQSYLPPPILPWKAKAEDPYGDFNYNNESHVLKNDMANNSENLALGSPSNLGLVSTGRSMLRKGNNERSEQSILTEVHMIVKRLLEIVRQIKPNQVNEFLNFEQINKGLTLLKMAKQTLISKNAKPVDIDFTVFPKIYMIFLFINITFFIILR